MKLCMIGVRGHNNYVLSGLPLTDVSVDGLCTAAEGDDARGLVSKCRDLGHEPRVWDQPAEMLDAVRPELVSIAGPFHRHAEICVEAFRRGIHVFCEKPVALTLDELEEVAEARESAGVHFAAMMGLRYDPAFHTAWRRVREGAVGEVRLLNARKSYRLGRRAPFYQERATYGGTIPWVGSHAVDWIRWYTSGKSFRSVYATHSAAHNRGHGELEVSALCHFTLEDDVYASVSIDYLRPDAAPSHGDDRLHIVGSEGVLDVLGGEVVLIGAGGDGEQRLETSCDRQIFPDFVAAAPGRSQALLGPEDAIEMTRACLLARESADSGRIVSFP